MVDPPMKFDLISTTAPACSNPVHGPIPFEHALVRVSQEMVNSPEGRGADGQLPRAMYIRCQEYNCRNELAWIWRSWEPTVIARRFGPLVGRDRLEFTLLHPPIRGDRIVTYGPSCRECNANYSGASVMTTFNWYSTSRTCRLNPDIPLPPPGKRLGKHLMIQCDHCGYYQRWIWFFTSPTQIRPLISADEFGARLGRGRSFLGFNTRRDRLEIASRIG